MNLAFRVTAQAILTIGMATVSWYAFEKPLNDLKRYFPYSGVTRNRLPRMQS
jgi:peptidoglycan/LPS O-acetylase OafA/YrhL